MTSSRRLRRIVAQSNLAATYHELGRREQALCVRRDVYSGTLKLHGEEHYDTLREACNYATTLVTLERFEEAKSLLHRTLPVTRRVLGECDQFTLLMRWSYALALFYADGSTLDDLREAVTALEDTTRTARRVFGNAHPTTERIEVALRNARADLRAALRARESPQSPPPSSESV